MALNAKDGNTLCRYTFFVTHKYDIKFLRCISVRVYGNQISTETKPAVRIVNTYPIYVNR